MSQACHKNTDKNARMTQKAKLTGSPSETEPDSDSAERIESEDKVLASSVIYSIKSSWHPMTGCKIN